MTALLHDCPGGCGRGVPGHRFACRTDWYRLPQRLRNAINDTYQRDPAAHRAAMKDAIEWYRANPKETTRG